MTTASLALDLAAQLVRIPSVNPMGRALPAELTGEGRVTDWLQEFFVGSGAKWKRYPVREDSIAGTQVKRENILARFDGSPSVADGGKVIMLEAHQDTVPIDGMTIDPFSGKIESNRLLGRGACDIKGGMACLLAAVTHLRKTHSSYPTVVVACTVNEEFGFCGAKHLTKLIADGGDEIIQAVPDAILVTEPTELHVVTCHKGMIRWRCETKGKAIHSSNPSAGENAIYRMAPVLGALEKFAARLSNDDADPLLGSPTLSIGTIKGGVSVNTVPDNCRIEIDRRLLPTESAESAREDIINVTRAASAHIHHDPPFITSPGLSAGPNQDLAEQLAAVASKHKPARETIGVPYGTDAAFLSACGSPTVVFGPGSINQAHTSDEWVSVKQLDLAVSILVDFMSKY